MSYSSLGAPMCVMCILMNFCFSLGNLSFVICPQAENLRWAEEKVFFLLLHPIEISMVWLLSMAPQFLSLLAPELPCLAFLEFFSFSALMCLFSPESMRMWGSAEASLPPGSLPGGLAKSGPLLPSGALPPHTHHPGNLLRVWHLP